jgi:hypothetical protein
MGGRLREGSLLPSLFLGHRRAQEGTGLSVVSLKTQGSLSMLWTQGSLSPCCGHRAAGPQQSQGSRTAAVTGQQGSGRATGGLQQKRQKIRMWLPKGDPHPRGRGAFPQWGAVTQTGGEPKRSGYVIFFCTFVKMNAMKKNIISLMGQPGLTVRNGRLINNLPDGTMGIQAAADARKMRRREEKINMMADAYERAEMRSEMREKMKKLF